MIRRLLCVLTVCLVANSPLLAAADLPALKVLFLGDQGHHRPFDRAGQITSVLAARWIEVTYTEDLANLNPETLAKYDALLVYANTTTIGTEQEKALLAYVTGGGGFVPIHCASYCFLNSPAYIALVGAQFQRHGMATFDTKVIDPAHPITKGLEPFRTRDETYVHHKYNETNRHILQTRTEGAVEEPWTWVRTEGKGRVFYTAYGHDIATWGQPGFHDLIERGIRWAANKGEVFDSRPRVASGLKPFDYKEADGGVPLYVPPQKGGGQAEPIRTMQKPVEPSVSQQHMALPRGFEVRLFAAEPEIAKPICMAWDHRGRLWIAETRDYPNEMQPPGQGRDRITICEDTDRDGRADKFTVFADKLSIPTSLTFANGGIVVHQAPETLFLKDTDGDDKADVRTVLFKGWETGDTHAGPSNLRYGFDNWLYGIVGYSGFRGTIGGERMNFRQGLYRFKPDGSKLEFLRNTSNNSWGVGLSEEGLVFGSTANGCPSVYLPIPNRYYESVRGGSASELRSIADSNRLFPVTDKVRQVDYHGGFTAAAGHALYTARTYPRPYWNSTAFVAEPTGHLVATFALERRGTDFAAHNAWNLLASDDEWTAPVAAEVGPDGNVWVIDWYSYIVQHNPTPRGFKTGKGAAYETPLRDKTHGRIYRVVYNGEGARPSPKLDPSAPESLIAALKSDNQLWRMHAQRLLVERGKLDVVPALVALVNDPSVDAIGLNPATIHALWTLRGLDALEGPAAPSVSASLKHPSAGVRRNALQVLPRNESSLEAILAARSAFDADAQVRMAALLALSEMPRSERAAAAIAEVVEQGALDQDRWLGDAAVIAAAAHDLEFLKMIAARSRSAQRPPGTAALEVVRRVAEHYARGSAAGSVGALLTALAEADRRVLGVVVTGLAGGWPKDQPAKLGGTEESALGTLLARIPSESRVSLLALAGRLGSDALDRHSAEISVSLLATVRDASKSDTARAEAARQVVEFRPRDAETVRQLLSQITPRTAPALVSALIDSAARSESPEVGRSLTALWPTLSPTSRDQSMRALLARADRTELVIDGLEHGTIPLTGLSLDQRQALAAHPNPAIAARAKQLLERGGGLPDPDRQKVIDSLAPLVLRGGDPARGREVYRQQCAKCHVHNGEGGKVGPDLSGVAVHPREELLIHILDPSRSVEGNFLCYTVATTDGRVINGLLASESRTSVELLDTEGKPQTVLRSEIDEMAASKKSLMPEGFEKQVAPEGLADLLAFLTQRGKYLPLDLKKAATVVSTQGMFFRKESPIERLVFPDWSPKTFEGIPFHLVDPQNGRAPNVIMLYSPNGDQPPRMPRSVTLSCRSPAKAIHFLSGMSGWGATGDENTPTVSMIVRLHYADGTTEDHPLQNGVHFADYIRRVNVSGSRFAFGLRGHQVRYLSVHPRRSDPVETIELVKGPDDTAPLVVAVTVEVAGS